MTDHRFRRQDYDEIIEAAGWTARHGFERRKGPASVVVNDDGPTFVVTVTVHDPDTGTKHDTRLVFPSDASALRIVRTVEAVAGVNPDED